MTEKTIIQEVVVVEGKDDTRRLQEVVEVDTIETIGSAINQEIIQRIRHAADVRGVIVLTDPDFPGEKIRKTIMAEVPTAKHAFIKREEGVPRKKGGSLGIEHASDEAILAALQAVMTPAEENLVSEIPQEVLIEYGLLSGENARARRQKLGEILRIGYTNGKQLKKRLRMFQISPQTFQAAMTQILKEERDG